MSKRTINLLSKNEISEIYDIPEFNDLERELYFKLNASEQKLLISIRKDFVKTFFILQLGYFKAKHRFFQIDLEKVSEDIGYITGQYFDYGNISPIEMTRERINNQKHIILQHFQYRECLGKTQDELKAQYLMIIKRFPKIRNTIRELTSYCDAQNIILPSYRTLQDLYTETFQKEQKRISSIVAKFPLEIHNQLDDLISSDDGILSLNDVRYDQKDFSYTEVIEEVKKVTSLTEIYKFCKAQMSKLGVSKNAIRYYSSNVEQYPIYRLRRMSKTQRYLYALCYVHTRYRMFMDNLIASFMHHVVLLNDTVKNSADNEVIVQLSKIIKHYPNLGEFCGWFPQQESKRFKKDKFFKEAYSMIEKDDFEKLAIFFAGSESDSKTIKWKLIESSSRLIALYLRPIILSVDFEHYSTGNEIIRLVEIIRTHYLAHKNPKKLKIPNELGYNTTAFAWLKTDSADPNLNPHRFEFFVYQKLYHHLDRGRMFCNDSMSYCDIDVDLLDEDKVKDAMEIVKQYGYNKIPIYCSDHLDTKLSELKTAWKTLYQNIDTNSGIIITKNKDGTIKWRLNYDSSEKLDDSFLKNLSKLDIADIFIYVNRAINIFGEFDHIKGRYTKISQPTDTNIIACILSEAFGFGIKKMSEMSDVKFTTLRSTKEDFIRYETLSRANNIILDKIVEFPIFKAWNLLDDKLLADIDGQKASTKTDTIQSRYSKKYLGKGKGLSILSLIANFVAVSVKNIGLNEYEGHHSYDMIYDNESDIKIDAVTGDNHTLNQLNFPALDSINVDFVPSIKNVRAAADELYSSDSVDNYKGLIKPVGQIKVERIKNEEKQITRVLLSLIMQENTQSTIIRKLNSHSRYASLRAGFIEYTKILKSIHVLNLINDMSLRKAIRTARNRTEAYHQLQNLIRKIYYGIYKGKKIVDHKVSTQAVRLVTNVVIIYNATILNELYLKMMALNYNEKDIETFLRISPSAWQHITLTGKYTFEGKEVKVNLNKIVNALEKELKYMGIRENESV